MIGNVITSIKSENTIKILKSLIYSIYQDKILSKEEIEYINYFIKMNCFDDEQINEIFCIDTRYEIDFENLKETLDAYSRKVLLFLFIVSSELFENSKLKDFIKNKILNKKTDSIENEIIEYSKKYAKLSIEIYNFIFKVESKSFFSRNFNKEEIRNYEKLFIIDENRLSSLDNHEKESFMKIMTYLIMEDNHVSIKEEEYLKMYANNLGFYDFSMNKNDSLSITIETIKNIKSQWFINLLIFSYVLSQDTIEENKIEWIRLKEVTKLLNIDEKELNSNIKLILEYKKIFEDLIKSLQSNKISNDKILDMGLSSIPFIKIINHLTKNDKPMEYGLKDIKKNINSDNIIICIDGFCSESSTQFEDWKNSFDIIGTECWIKGFKWASGNSLDVLTWYEKVNNTPKAANKLVQDISLILELSPNKKISLMGHSLGARVIYNTLLKLKDMDLQVEEVYLMGGAVCRADKVAWANVLSSVKNRVFNFYSVHDDILKNLYQTTMISEKPIGLGEIEYYKYTDLKMAELINVDVSDLVKGHKEYKNKLSLFPYLTK